jgi:hypothetical protein
MAHLPADLPENQSPFEYASRALSSRPKSLLQVTGFHYLLGLGGSTLIGLVLLLLPPIDIANIPLTVSCGGIPVILIQWGLVALPAFLRRCFFGQILYERSAILTAGCGAVGGLLIFGMPYLLRNIARSDLAYALVTLAPLCVYPILASFVIFRSGLPASTMQKNALEYSPEPEVVRSLTLSVIVGRCIAITSLAMPFLLFGVIFIVPTTPSAVRIASLSILVASCLLGLIGIVGIYWWGEKWVLVPSILGIAFSISWYLLARYGGG